MRDAKSIFGQAQEIGTPSERAAYLDQACGGDVGLRANVEALLRAADEAGDFMDGPAVELAQTMAMPLAAEGPGTVIGPYKLMEQIGEGGFGLVFVAEQHRPVRRKVALKIIKPGMDTRDVIARFEAERQALALMDHPNIAKVFDAGTTESGRPYFVMELVRGVPITDYCDQHHLIPRERLDLFVSVCHAIQHAHQKGIIHRDVKPTNVMVTLHDGVPVVKVIDFGVAKALSQQLSERTIYTQFAQMLGTPLYMSPEQAEMSGLDIDTRSDIYALGVLLYELLTGTTPFDRQRFSKAAVNEIRRIIRDEQPPKPSTRLSQSGDRLPSIAAVRGIEPAHLSKLVRGDLDWITMKCLEKDRNRRYDTANGLAHDIERHLNDEPVEASPPSAWYRVRKTVRRNKRTFATAFAVAAALLIGTAVSIYFGVEASDRAYEAHQNLANARLEKKRADESAQQAALQREEARDSLCRSLYDEARATLASGQLGRRWQALNLLQRAEKLRARERRDVPTTTTSISALPSKADLRSEAVRALLLKDAQISDKVVIGIARFGMLSTDGSRAVGRYPTAEGPAQPVKEEIDRSLRGLRVFDVRKGRELLSPRGNSSANCLALSADGKYLAVGEETSPGIKVTIWAVTDFHAPSQVLSWADTQISESDHPSHQLVFSPNGRRLAYVRTGHTQVDFVIWDVETRAQKSFHQSKEAGAISEGSIFERPLGLAWGASTFTPNSEQLAIRIGPTKMRLFDARGNELPREIDLPEASRAEVVFHPRDALLATITKDLTVVLWDYVKHEERARVQTPFLLLFKIMPATDLAFDRLGKYLAVGSVGGIVVYETPKLNEAFRFQNVGADDATAAVRWTSDGQDLVSINAVGLVQVRELILNTPRRVVPIDGGTSALVFSPDGKWVGAKDGQKRSIRLLNRATGKTQHEYHGTELVFRRDSQQFAVINDAEVLVAETKSGKELVRRPLLGDPTSAAFTQEGQLLIALNGAIQEKPSVLNLSTNEVVWRFPPEAKEIRHRPHLSIDGRYVSTESAGNDNRLKAIVWELSSSRKIAEIESLGSMLMVHFSPNYRWAVSLMPGRAAVNPEATLFKNPEQLGVPGLMQPTQYVIWSVRDGKKRFAVRPLSDYTLRFYLLDLGAYPVAFSPDEHFLAVTAQDGVVSLWNAERGEEVFRFKPTGDSKLLPGSVNFTRDGRFLAWYGEDFAKHGGIEYLDLSMLQQELGEIGLNW